MNLGIKQINGVDTEVHADKTGSFYIQIDGKSASRQGPLWREAAYRRLGRR